MGYYTRHTLEHDDKGRIDHEEGITDTTGYEYSVFDDDEIKWYDHEKDMRNYSKCYPKVTFILYGVGEEEGDYWKEYYKNGDMVRRNGEMTVTYEPFYGDYFTEDK